MWGKARFMKKIILPSMLVLFAIAGNAQTDSVLKKVDSARKFLATTDVVYPYIDTPPLYEGGNEKWIQYLDTATVLKQAIRRANEQGAPAGRHTVIVKFSVDENGNASDFQTTNKAIGYGLEEAAVELLKGVGKWIPANVEGKNTKAWLNLPINFTIGK
jgi:TonB family protein